MPSQQCRGSKDVQFKTPTGEATTTDSWWCLLHHTTVLPSTQCPGVDLGTRDTKRTAENEVRSEPSKPEIEGGFVG